MIGRSLIGFIKEIEIELVIERECGLEDFSCIECSIYCLVIFCLCGIVGFI